jgi:general stress protein 26
MRGIDFCMMTTHGGRKLLRSRPMSNNGEVDFDGDAWFFTSRDSRKVTEIEKDKRVELSYVGGTRREPIWISVSGTAEIVDDEEQKAELWMKELEQWFENGPEDPEVVLIHVKGEQAAWWTYGDQGEIKL